MRPLLSKRVIHLCLDMQGMFGRDGPWPTPWMERVVPNVWRWLESAGQYDLHPVHSADATPTDLPGMWREFYRSGRGDAAAT